MNQICKIRGQRNNWVHLVYNWKIQQKNGHINKSIQYTELGSNNETTKCADKDKQTSRAYDIKGGENNLSTSENKKGTGWLCLYL